MYAVVKTGGKQYRVQKEDVVLVEKLKANDGDQLVLNDVLMVGDGKKVTLGTPLVNDAAVMAQVIRQTRGPKITMIYKRRRKNSRRKQGHKQDLTLLKIIDIAETGGSKLSPKKATAKSTEKKIKVEAKTKTDRRLIKMRTYDNPHLPSDFISRLEDNYEAGLLQAYLNGEFCNITTGVVYSRFDRSTHVIEERPNIENEPLRIGIDFNIGNTNAVIGLAIGDSMTVFDEINASYDTDTLAKEIKARWPECKIMYGGPQVPDKITDWHDEHDFVDICVHQEGEITFNDIVSGKANKDIAGITYNENGDWTQTGPSERIINLEDIHLFVEINWIFQDYVQN